MNCNTTRYLPLEQFDDTDSDDRLPSEWIALGVDANGQLVGTPGRTLVEKTADDGASSWTWEECVARGYDEVTSFWCLYFTPF